MLWEEERLRAQGQGYGQGQMNNSRSSAVWPSFTSPSDLYKIKSINYSQQSYHELFDSSIKSGSSKSGSRSGSTRSHTSGHISGSNSGSQTGSGKFHRKNHPDITQIIQTVMIRKF